MKSIILASLIYGSFISVLSYCFSLGVKNTKISNFALGSHFNLSYFISYYLYKITKINPYLNLLTVAFIIGIINYSLYRVTLFGNKTHENKITSYIVIFFYMYLIITFGPKLLIWVREYFDLRYIMSILMKECDFRLFDLPGVLYLSLLLVIAIYFFDRIWVNQRESINPSLIWFLSGFMTGLVGGLAPFWFLSSMSLSGHIVVLSMLGGSYLFYKKDPSFSLIGGFIVGFGDILIAVLMMEVFEVRSGEFRALISGSILTIILLTRILSHGNSD